MHLKFSETELRQFQFFGVFFFNALQIFKCTYLLSYWFNNEKIEVFRKNIGCHEKKN